MAIVHLANCGADCHPVLSSNKSFSEILSAFEILTRVRTDRFRRPRSKLGQIAPLYRGFLRLSNKFEHLQGEQIAHPYESLNA